MILTKDSKKTNSTLNLSLQLAKTNFKLSNEGTYLGVLWYLLEPLALFLIILIIASYIPSNIPNYFIYLLVGLISFNFFRKATLSSINIIKNHQKIIKSIRFPYESLIISKTLESIFSHSFEILILIVFLLFFDISLIGLIFYPIILLFFTLFILGVSFILSVIGININDSQNVWNLITTLIFFGSPIFYSIEKDSLLYYLNLINPLFYFLEIIRTTIIFQKIPEIWIISTTILFSTLIFFIGVLIFEKHKNKFAEKI